jgi:hypothetical protein
MADYWPRATGNWSTLSNWQSANGVLSGLAGTLPTILDDVYANGFTVTIDINATAIAVRTTTRPAGTNYPAGVVGGGFTMTNGVSLTAGVLAGPSTCLFFGQAAPNSCTVYGNLTGSITTNGFFAFNNAGTGTVNIFGDVRAGSAGNSDGVRNTGNGTVNIVGIVRSGNGNSGDNPFGINNNTATGTVNITGGVIAGTGTTGNQLGVSNAGILNLIGFVQATAGANYHGIGNSGTANISGSVTGGSGSTAYGINNTGTVSITGNVIGGTGSSAHGVNSSAVNSIVNVFGNATGGINGGVGVNNSSSGFVYVTKAIGNGFGLGSAGITAGTVGLANSQNGRAYIEQAEFGSRGFTPISGPVYILPSNQNTLTGVLTALGNTVTFYNSLSVDGLLPPASSVQLGTVYNVGNSVGTMAVPPSNAVQFGVPVDNTVGVAALTPQTVWGYSRLSATDVGSMGDRLRNAATTQSIGYQIASFNL